MILYYPGDYIRELCQRYKINQVIKPPIPVWIVAGDLIYHEAVYQLRLADGPTDPIAAYTADYCDTIPLDTDPTMLVSRNSRGTFYLFPDIGSAPRLVELKDKYGTFRQWVLERKESVPCANT